MAATGFYINSGTSAKNRQRILYRPYAGFGAYALLLAIVFIFLSSSTSDVAGEEAYANIQLYNRTDSGICKSVDIRNSMDQFNVLKNCNVVEGFVQILLFDNVSESFFSNISFPKLTEITDYLLLYRVNGLRSLGQLFPNLTVIRGQKLFYGYALVVFEMSSLQEIGLYSLTDIMKGQIRIDKNPSLCFVHSIAWDRITHEAGEHFIKSLKPENECPICPGDDTVNSEGSRTSVSICNRTVLGESQQGRHLCWNRQHCQKLCPTGCSACTDSGECCDRKCLGGCFQLNNRQVCKVCRNFTVGVDEDQCRDHCPQGYYEYLGRRCITKDECTDMKRPLDLHGRIQYENPYKIHGRSCLLECPPNYMDDFQNHTCTPCEGRCKKECPSTNIDNLSSAQQLRGCTHIKGSLEIQIRGGRNMVNVLEENLNMIEEIDGYLKIVRSFPLVSLNFLRNLRVIHGHVLESQKYVFVVLDNQNLQDLWDWKNRTLRIENGKLFFHFNPKLCYNKIEAFWIKANLSQVSELEVAVASNGDKIACEVSNMDVNVTKIKSKAVILEWKAFQMDDNRKLLGYVVYSIEAPHTNITLYDGRDACGGDGWRVDDVGIQEDGTAPLNHLLAQLKPYTQYAFYVKTYTVASERSGAQSKIQYFRTLPYIPSKPLEVQITSNGSNSLIITWKPPDQPNGNLTHYIVSGRIHKDINSDDLLNNRNYCNEPLQAPSKPQIVHEPVTVSKPKMNDSCACDKDESKQINFKVKEETETLSQISFEDQLHNQVYIKKGGSEPRRKRDIPMSDQTYFPQDTEKVSVSDNSTTKNVTINGTLMWESFSYFVYGRTELYLDRLYHFTQYIIELRACRQHEGLDDESATCSSTSITTGRTQKKDGADNITNFRIANKSLGMVTIAWDEPKEPNGLILTYQIDYRRMDKENSKPIPECITRKLFLNESKTYTLKGLSAGNYSLRLLATSQAGPGDFTQYYYIDIEELSTTSNAVIGIVVGILIVFAFFGAVAFYVCLIRPDQKKSMKLITSVNPEYVSSVYVPDDWEVARRKIELIKELGQGSFGMVYEGIARDIKGKMEIRCAVKTVNEHATNRERIEFLNEASVMKAFDTAHVVRLLGVVSQGQPTLVIMELMVNGDLKSYLRSHRPDAETYTGRQPPTLKRILEMAIEIADGMAYLCAKKFVHRDLAARNCMVAEDLTVKIGDFGMTRDIYETDYYRKGTKGLLPVRWMAPESLKDGVFTSGSDVWSYGVVLWEMATLASQPYQGLSNDQVLRYVIDGGVMERPENCPDKLYNLMRFCWQHKPSSRPTFLELASHLVDDATVQFTQVSFYYSAAGIEARNAYISSTLSQDDPSTPLRMLHALDEDFSIGSSEGESEDDGGGGGVGVGGGGGGVGGGGGGSDMGNASTHIEFPVFPPPPPPTSKDGSTNINGYVSGHPKNGTATTQC